MKNSTKKIRRLSISKSRLASLGDERLSVLAAFSFHLNEVNVIWRAYNCCHSPNQDQFELNLAIAIQRHTLLRIWSAKIFEFLVGLDDLSKGKKKFQDEELLSFTRGIVTKLSPPSQRGELDRSIASKFRHETTFHLDPKAIRKRLKLLSSETETDFFFDSVDAGSFFPFGEDAVFSTSFTDYVASIPRDQQLGVIKDWSDWVIFASRELIYIFSDFLEKFVYSTEHHPEWEWLDLSLEAGMIFEKEKSNMPLFFKIEDVQ